MLMHVMRLPTALACCALLPQVAGAVRASARWLQQRRHQPATAGALQGAGGVAGDGGRAGCGCAVQLGCGDRGG
jgi:hypothetical protein